MMLQFEVYFKSLSSIAVVQMTFLSDCFFFHCSFSCSHGLQRFLNYDFDTKINYAKKCQKINSSTSHSACLLSFGRCFGGRLGFAFLFTQNPIGLFLKNSLLSATIGRKLTQPLPHVLYPLLLRWIPSFLQFWADFGSWILLLPSVVWQTCFHTWRPFSRLVWCWKNYLII